MKLSKILTLCLALVLGGSLALAAMGGVSGQCVEGNGHVGSQAREVAEFTAIRATGAFDVTVVCGRPQRVKITAETNLIPKIRTRIQGKALVIDTETSICAKRELHVTISVPRLEALAIDGAVDATVEGIKTDRFALELTGSGSAVLSGRAGRLEARLSGAGNLDAKSLTTQEAAVAIDGVGQADVHADQRLEATIQGTGDIVLYGEAKDVEKNISGVGDVIRGR